MSTGYVIWTFRYLPTLAESKEISPVDASFLISVVGICNTLGRILSGNRLRIESENKNYIWTTRQVNSQTVSSRGLQRDVVYPGRPIAPLYMSLNSGGGEGDLGGLSQTMQINFGDLTPYLTYG